MRRAFTLEYWPDAGGFVGRLREVPGVFSQGDTLAELEDNVRDAYALVLADQSVEERSAVQRKEIEVAIRRTAGRRQFRDIVRSRTPSSI